MDVSISRVTQLRGRLAVGVRHRFTQPVSRRLPVSALRQYHRLRRQIVPWRYTDADPAALLWVTPSKITQSLLASAPSYPQWGRVVGGGWDHDSEPFGERAVVQAIRQHFEAGRPWNETALVSAYREQLERFGNAWEHTSWTAFETRCQHIEQLYDSLSEHGYQPLSAREPQLAGTVGGLVAEINVDIGRHGEIYWRGYGQHRLAIAQLLGIESVPVVVNRRHRQWQTTRTRLQDADRDVGIEPERRTHPDLRE